MNAQRHFWKIFPDELPEGLLRKKKDPEENLVQFLEGLEKKSLKIPKKKLWTLFHKIFRRSSWKNVLRKGFIKLLYYRILGGTSGNLDRKEKPAKNQPIYRYHHCFDIFRGTLE